MKKLSLYALMFIILIQAMSSRATINLPDFVESHGYPIESHTVTTSDGYILTLHRIPHNRFNSTIPSKVALMPTCMLCSGMAFLLLGPNEALGFLLSDRGYDVWMLNARGTTYSQKHTRLSTKSFKYWDHSFHENGMFDLPESIDYILNKTGAKKLDIASFSMGGAASFVMLSKKPEYNDKVRAVSLASPAVYLKYTWAPITQLAPIQQFIYGMTKQMKLYFFPFDELNANRNIRSFCRGGDFINQIFCNVIFYTFAGQNQTGIVQRVIPSISEIMPDMSSTKTLAHFAQAVGRGGFREFDYGRFENMRRYGSSIPPRYPLEKITAPIFLLSSTGDGIVPARDVSELANDVKSVRAHFSLDNPAYGHGHFIWGEHSKQYIFNKQIDFLESNDI